MSSRIAVVVVHGIRTEKSGYSHKFSTDVMSRLKPEHRECVEWREVFWGDITHVHQRAYFDRAKARGRFQYLNMRREFVLQGLGDAAAYMRTRTAEGSVYHKIQERLSKAIEELDTPNAPPRILVLVGHSLGCQIISSYVWDINRRKPARSETASDYAGAEDPIWLWSPFRQLETLAGIVTFGSNMPIFTFAFSPERVIPITHPRRDGDAVAFPGAALADDVAAKAKWLNFYSPFDVLGYPLKPINEAYEVAIALDKAVLSGGAMFWHPLYAHSGYWNHRVVIEQTSNLLSDLID